MSQLIRLPNQAGTFLLMLPTFWALTLAAQGRPSPPLLVIFAAGSFLMRSAGVAINDLADRPVDRQVARTRTRPLASGALRPRDALIVFAVLVTAAALLLWFLNRLTVLLSPVALLLAACYPFAKRLLPLPQLVLGAAFGWGVVMAWAAASGRLDPPVWYVYAAAIFWALAYDTIYAVQDREDDARIGVRSAAVLFGRHVWLAVALSSAGMLASLAWAGRLVGVGAVYYGVLAAVAGFLTQQVWRLRGGLAPSQAFALFRQHVWVGWVILAGIWLGFL